MQELKDNWDEKAKQSVLSEIAEHVRKESIDILVHDITEAKKSLNFSIHEHELVALYLNDKKKAAAVQKVEILKKAHDLISQAFNILSLIK